MNYRCLTVMLAMLPAILTTACGTKFVRDIEKQVGLAKSGVVDTTTNIENGLKNSCNEAPKVSADADEILSLVSSEDNTVFTVDGKEMGTSKQLKVCINSSGEHTVIAAPIGCDAKTEKLKPPYDSPHYEFRFMLAECKAENVTTAVVEEAKPLDKKAQNRRRTKSKKQ